MKWMFAGLTIGIVVTVFGTLIWYQVETQPLHRGDNHTISYTLADGVGVGGAARGLQQAHIIRSATAFEWFVTLHGQRGQLEAGSYDLGPGESVDLIAGIISHGAVSVNQLVIPEGKTVAQIKVLAAAKGISTADFNSALADSYSNSFLAQKPADVDLEGYLFPDSYTIPKPANAHALVAAMLDNFGRKSATPDIISALAAEGMTLHQGLTLASIVEREVSNPSDRAMVAGVFMNRLKAGQPLQSDVTVQYAADINGLPFNINLDSAYNTYLHPGLPPGPICNPGLVSLEAVAHPTANNYLYFVAGKDGKTHFAQTFAEHQANVAKYLGN